MQTDVDGYVFGVRKNALQILLPRYGLETTLFLRDNDGKSVGEFNEEVTFLQALSWILFNTFLCRALGSDTDDQRHDYTHVRSCDRSDQRGQQQCTTAAHTDPSGETIHRRVQCAVHADE